MTFFKEEPVEGANSEDLGMPVVKGDSLGLSDFILWKTFHSSPNSSAKDLSCGQQYVHTLQLDM